MTHILVAGNPMDGFEYVGPFNGPGTEANEYGDQWLGGRDWWVVLLQEPAREDVLDSPTDTETVDRIFELLDGTEWDSDTMSAVADLINRTGRTIREPGTQGPFCDLCGEDPVEFTGLLVGYCRDCYERVGRKDEAKACSAKAET